MNVMIDLETMSTKPRAAIASIAAVLFDPTREQTIEELSAPNNIFYVRVDLRTQPARQFDADTIYWWLEQSQEARSSLALQPGPFEHVMRSLRTFMIGNNVRRGWSYGANFDHVILQTAFDDVGLLNPIRYNQQFCARTVIKLANVQCPMDNGVNHDALADSVRQARWLQQAFQILGLRSE